MSGERQTGDEKKSRSPTMEIFEINGFLSLCCFDERRRRRRLS